MIREVVFLFSIIMNIITRLHFSVLMLLILILRFTSSHSFSVGEKNKRPGDELFKNFIGDDRRIFACSGKDFFSFESNGAVAWTVHLNYTCNADIAPVNGGGSRKIYVVAENRVLKIHPLKIGTSEEPVEVFFDAGLGEENPGEIVGVSASIYSSVVLVNVKKRGLFAYKLQGTPLWTAGPIISRHGYQQGCKKNTTECYFSSPPVIDHCEASILLVLLQISNTVGELYSISVRRPYFKWIKDLSSYGVSFVVTPGNNGRSYVTVPDSSLVLALDASTGDTLWERSVGPLSSSDYEPVVDSNGWISFGSLDGSVYSLSPTGSLRKSSNSVSSTSVVQVNPILDCSGYGVYVSRTETEETTIADRRRRVSAFSKPKKAVFTHFVPASGAVLYSEAVPGNELLFEVLSRSDLGQHFAVDERTLLAFFAASRNDSSLPCRSTGNPNSLDKGKGERMNFSSKVFSGLLKLASGCSKVKPKKKSSSINRGVDGKNLISVLVIESILVVVLSAAVRYCCVFWRKKKLQSLGLSKFLDKRASLKSEERALGIMISAAAEDGETTAEELAKERELIRRKLSSRYSLGRDDDGGEASSSIRHRRLYGLRGSKNGESSSSSFAIFHSVGRSSSPSSNSTSPSAYPFSVTDVEEDEDEDEEDSFGLRRRRII